MICTTVRNGFECPFMSAKGCTYNGGICHEIVEQCNGCKRTIEYSGRWYCSSCPDPAMKWRNGNCNLATHVKTEVKEVGGKLNPIKASKRGKR